jgi:hypothetical protein
VSAAFHIAALGVMTFNAAIWSKNGWINITLKLLFVGLSAWASVVVAKDWFV